MNTSKPIHKLIFFKSFQDHFRKILNFYIDYFGIDIDQRSFRKYLKTNRINQIRESQDIVAIVLIESLQINRCDPNLLAAKKLFQALQRARHSVLGDRHHTHTVVLNRLQFGSIAGLC